MSAVMTPRETLLRAAYFNGWVRDPGNAGPGDTWARQGQRLQVLYTSQTWAASGPPVTAYHGISRAEPRPRDGHAQCRPARVCLPPSAGLWVTVRIADDLLRAVLAILNEKAAAA